MLYSNLADLGLKQSILVDSLKNRLASSLTWGMIYVGIGGLFGCNEAPPKHFSTHQTHSSSSPSSSLSPDSPDHIHSINESANLTDSNRSQTGDDTTPIGELKTTFLFKVISRTSNQVVVDLLYQGRASQPDQSPRAMELWVEFHPDIQLVSSLALESINESEKGLVVQERSPGVLRLLVYGTNVNPIQSGGLARLTLKADPFPESLIYIQRRDQILAPPPANQQIIFGEPVSLKGE